MRKLFNIALLSILFPSWALAQFTSEYTALNNLRKGKYDKAQVQLNKELRKDSLSTGAHYVYAVYFFTPANPDFQIDSAYAYIMKAYSDYQLATVKQRDRLKKLPVDSILLVMYRERIDSAAFERAKAKNTEGSYIDFLQRFQFALQRPQAIELRDEVAYLNALKENTYSTFLTYLEKYPQSIRAPEAKTRYEKLLFESKTKDKKLSSYESFLRDYPLTPYRNEVEKQIFEISTATGEVQEFERFLKSYPESSKARTARNILYHLLKEDERPVPRSLVNDSIQKLQDLEKLYLVPFLKNDVFGFMNERGEEIIKPAFGEISDDYLCGNITDEVLVFPDAIVARNGVVIYQGEIKEVIRMGSGFLKIKNGNCVKIIHASGFKLGDDCAQDATLLGKNFIALQRSNRWSVWSFAGRMLMDYSFDQIQQVGDAVIVGRSGKFKIAKLKDLAKPADQTTISFSQEYDEVKPWPKGMFLVRTDKDQGVLNPNLKDWIKPGRQEITQTFFGAISQTPVGFKVHERTSAPSQNFSQLKMNQKLVAVQQSGTWRLIDPASRKVESPAFDSLFFTGPFLVGSKNDSLRVYLEKDTYIDIHNSRIYFLPGRDSLFFLLVDDGDRKNVYDIHGQQLFSTTFDKVEYNNEGYFTIHKEDKRGLIALNGKIIVQPEYDALGSVINGTVQTLKDRKFGLLDIVRRREIKTEYDKNIVPYNATRNIAFKGGLCGLIGWDNKPVTPLEYEEIRYWNDSSALVKKNFNWIIYNFVEKKIVMDVIRNYKVVLDTEEEKILIVQQENSYGVISNRKGIIIPPTFTDIVNLGSSSVPLYFTEKHVEEASIFVVIYYDKNGSQLRKQVFETADYEKIYCSGN